MLDILMDVATHATFRLDNKTFSHDLDSTDCFFARDNIAEDANAFLNIQYHVRPDEHVSRSVRQGNALEEVANFISASFVDATVKDVHAHFKTTPDGVLHGRVCYLLRIRKSSEC